MGEEPRDHYIYAYLDGDTPFYIGKGSGSRYVDHLKERVRRKKRNQKSYFYRKLNKMLQEGREPEILILQDGLPEELAYAIETDLILLVGGPRVGPLCNVQAGRNRPGVYTLERGIESGTAVKVWGEWFPSLKHVSKDPRCVVKNGVLFRRIAKGWDIEEAVKTPIPDRSIMCWGEKFDTLKELCEDPRCATNFETLRSRIKRYGWIPEVAAGTPSLWARGPNSI